MIYKLLLLINLFNLLHTSPTSNLLNFNQLNARIQCEYKDKDGDSLILNCTLTNGLVSESGGILVNSESPQAPSSVQSLNIRVGLDESWRTPWESLSINPNIIRTIIWRASKLSEMGEFAFKDLRYLQKIDLSTNKLAQLNSNVFNSFELDLTDLDLSQNLFQQVPSDIFENQRLQNLESLRLNENPIVHLSKKSFDKIRFSVKTIELNYCKIRSIEANTFDQMKQLDSLSLIGNHLRSLSYFTFKDLTLRSFYVHENPFNCDCHLRWLIEYVKNVDYQQQMYESPSSVAPKSKQPFSPFNYIPQLGVAQAAQQFLKCEQPNSLKSKHNFLDINPDSFMCDIQIEFRDQINEATYELGESALLICDVYGDPEPDVYWSYGQRPIGKGLQNDDDKYYVNEVRVMLNPRNPNFNSFTNKTSELRIKDLQSMDFGVYTCTAEIKGSNNRKQIGFSLKQIRTGPATSLSSAGDLLMTNLRKFIVDLRLNEYKSLASVSNSTLLILFTIFVSLLLFVFIIFLFICWKCCCAKKKKQMDKKMIYNPGVMTKEKEMANLISQSNDCLDSQNSNLQQNYSHLANDSSATLLSNNKISNSIRMAYPNYNDIYANHSLLTTTSTTTGSTYPTNHIAIDTSNQTPKYHLLPQHQTDSYYDDLRYNSEENHQTYASPFRQQNSYSPIVRRDDPTIPLYATLKPKMGNPQHQRQYSSNYVQYTTLHRSTPPLPAPRRGNSYYNGQVQLPPPPPPPPVMPPVKPKRTFEYSKDLHSESGAFLLAEEKIEFDQSDCDVNYQTYKRIKRKPTKGNLQKVINSNAMPNSSTTSLDEEDLDLNDLKDFEDVTFDNLRKPNEGEQSSGTTRFKQHMGIKKNQLMILQQGIKNNAKNLLEQAQQASTNSEQSLLLKSSSSSSDKSSSNTNLNPNNESPNTVITTASDKQDDRQDGLENVDNQLDDKNKIYEETEI